MDTRNSLLKHLEKLPHFLSVAEHGGINRAAKRLGISQPSLSESIKSLELALETQLFTRTSKGVRISDKGKILHQFCKRLVLDSNHTEEKIRKQNHTAIRHIRIGTKEPFAVHLWPRYIKFINKHSPEIQIDLVTFKSNTRLLSMLLKGKLDIVMTSNPTQIDGIRSYEIFKDKYSIYSSSNRASSPQRLYLYSEAIASNNKNLAQALDKKTFSIFEIRSVNSFETARALVISGLGAAVLPGFMRGESNASNALDLINPNKYVSKPFGSLSVCACISEGTPHGTFLRSFIQSLKKAHNLAINELS